MNELAKLSSLLRLRGGSGCFSSNIVALVNKGRDRHLHATGCCVAAQCIRGKFVVFFVSLVYSLLVGFLNGHDTFCCLTGRVGGMQLALPFVFFSTTEYLFNGHESKQTTTRAVSASL